MPRINYARADIARATKLNRDLDLAWLRAIEMDRDPAPAKREYKEVDMQPKFVNVAGLYERTSTTGRTVYAGTWGATRVYLLPTGLPAPSWWLAVRAEDYDPKRHGVRVESPQDATAGRSGAFGAKDGG